MGASSSSHEQAAKSAHDKASLSLPLATDKQFTLKEIATHNNKKDCWLVINDVVYDVTNYLDEHPGGPNWLMGVITRAFISLLARLPLSHA